jgi:hypothetical protein
MLIDPATDFREQERHFFELLGRAVARWQLVEMQLFRIHARLVRSENSEVASAAFHSIINFRQRLGMMDAAARIFLATSPMLAKWTALKKRAKKAAVRQNTLTHSVVVFGG